MSLPRINPRLMSAAARANLERLQMEFSQCENTEETNVRAKGEVSQVSRKKKTLTPDMAGDLVKDVKVSEDGNEVKILLAVDPSTCPTAQQKGAFVGKDGKVHFFTKSKIAKAGKALKDALSPYAHHTAKWGRVPIQFTFDAFFAYPTSTPKKHRHKIGPHLERPDGDNLLKLPADILTESGYWADDSLIDTYIIRKRRTTGPACIRITITNLQPKFVALYREIEAHDNPNLFAPAESSTRPTETNPLSDLVNGQTTSNSNQRTQQIGM